MNQRGAGLPVRWLVYERALKILPASYKLWKLYLDERVEHCLQLISFSASSTSPTAGIEGFEATNGCFERSLVFLGRMPRLWLDYLSFLLRQRRITASRRALNRALQSLPVTQHRRVWELGMKLAAAVEPRAPRTALALWARHWQVADRLAVHEDYLAFLMRVKAYDRAAVLLLELADSCKAAEDNQQPPPSQNKEDESEYSAAAFWDRLCSLLMAHGEHVTSIDANKILRIAIASASAASSYVVLAQGAKRPSTAAGVYWCALALLHIRQRQFEAARAIYEEALEAVPTVRDFSLVFDAYARFEETLLAAEMERRRLQAAKGDPIDEAVLADLDKRLARLDEIYERRNGMLQEIRLAQQPQSVAEWERLVALQPTPEAKVAAYERALNTLNPKKAKGDLPGLWDAFARLFEGLAETEGPAAYDSCVDIYERAVTEPWAEPDDHAAAWIAYAEFTRRRLAGTLDAAIDLLGRATAPNAGRVARSPVLWSYLLDLEEARGAPAAICAAYEHVLRLGIATLQTVVNYAQYLMDSDRQDEAFRIYERGIAIFGYPLAFDLWNIYLPKAIAAWGPTGKIERIRDLFEQALHGCPAHLAKPLFLIASAAEEQWGQSARAALRMLERAAVSVPDASDKLELYTLLVSKTIAVAGLTAARPVYETAMTDAGLTYASQAKLASAYASLETRLGEYDRARAIYAHTGSLGDPRTVPSLWEAWAAFEVQHGDEESYREMLRVKRAAQAKFMIAPAAFVPATTAVSGDDKDEAMQNIGTNEEEIQLDL